MAKETVLIGCRLPHGLTLEVREPMSPEGQPGEIITSAKINGMNSSKIIGATYVTTSINAELWETWKKERPNYPALKNGAIFEANTEDQAAYKGKQLAKERTGFEAIKQDEAGVKPVAKD